MKNLLKKCCKMPLSADHLKHSPLQIAGFAAVGSVGPAGCSGASVAIGGAVAPRPGRLSTERAGPGAARCRGSAGPPLLPAAKARERGADGSRSNGSVGSAILLIDSLFQAIGFSLPFILERQYLEVLFSPESRQVQGT